MDGVGGWVGGTYPSRKFGVGKAQFGDGLSILRQLEEKVFVSGRESGWVGEWRFDQARRQKKKKTHPPTHPPTYPNFSAKAGLSSIA